MLGNFALTGKHSSKKMKASNKDARVIDPRSFNGKKVDRIENGVITEIGKDLKPKKAEVWTEENLCVSPGWIWPLTLEIRRRIKRRIIKRIRCCTQVVYRRCATIYQPSDRQ